MTDVASARRHKNNLARMFGDWLPGRFRENYPAGTRIAVVVTFDI